MIAATASSGNEKYHVGSDSFNLDDRTQVINHYDTFCIFDRWGDIHPQGKKAQGIFYKGTRFINKLELRLNELRPVLLSSSIKQDNEILSVDLTNPQLSDCNIMDNMVHMRREQFIRNGVYYEALAVRNFSEKTCPFRISLSFDADFSDIFEIRGMHRNVKKPNVSLSSYDDKIVFAYKGLDNIERKTEVIFKTKGNYSIENTTAVFTLNLSPKEKVNIEYIILFRDGEDAAPQEKLPDLSGVKKAIQADILQVQSGFATVHSNNESFNQWVTRSRSDLQSLLAQTPYGQYPYAGVPWYNTAFGRDGIITAMEVLWLSPEIARDALLFLAQKQSNEFNEEKDAEPGKIIHEIRHGEMANTGEVPFKEYYGTIDATPLFIMLAGMYYMHTGDANTIKTIWPNLKKALTWIDDYGDLDGDGFVEYKNKSENGLTNQGWKDSYDAIMYADGELCEAPIALCEVQGYVYAAKNYAATMARVMKEDAYASELEAAASKLKQHFNEAFWNDELGAFVLALDGNKKQCRVLASNAGHCLFTGIADEKKAAILARQLTGKEMFSGWGIRTLSANEVRYNPMSYHNGSVWPHDNAIIASGLARYGFQHEVLKVIQGMYDASLFIDMQRLPELFCGFEKRPKEGPTSYPVACSPQAWAVGTVFMLLQASLQIEVDGVNKIVCFNKPQLPDFINQLTITNLRVGNGYCHFEVNRHKYDVSFHIIHKPDDWQMIIKV